MGKPSDAAAGARVDGAGPGRRATCSSRQRRSSTALTRGPRPPGSQTASGRVGPAGRAAVSKPRTNHAARDDAPGHLPNADEKTGDSCCAPAPVCPDRHHLTECTTANHDSKKLSARPGKALSMGSVIVGRSQLCLLVRGSLCVCTSVAAPHTSPGKTNQVQTGPMV